MNKRKNLFKSLIPKILFAGLCIFLGYNIGKGTYLNFSMQQKFKKSPATKLHNSNITCPLYGEQPVDSEYYLYKIQPGDTLLSIAERLLGDSGRMYEISALNKVEFPFMSENPTNLEVGATIKIPSSNFGVLKHGLKRLAGLVMEYDDRNIAITVKANGGVTHSMSLDYQVEKYDSPYQFGDCVTILMDASSGDIERIIRISRQ